MTRPSWDESFMLHAEVASLRCSCPRKRVGAVLVLDNRMVAQGYAGSIVGTPSCLEAGCMISVVDGNESCVRTIHAEANALMHALRFGIGSLNGATCYVTVQPCWGCFRLLAQAGVKRVVYGDKYSDARPREHAKSLGIVMAQVSRPALVLG